MSTQASIEDRIKKEVAYWSRCEPSEIRNDQAFVNDLGFDSLDTVECVMAIEDEFGMVIPDEQAEKILTIQQAIDYVTENLRP